MMDLDPPQCIQLDKFSASIISAPHYPPGQMLLCSEQPNNCMQRCYLPAPHGLHDFCSGNC